MNRSTGLLGLALVIVGVLWLLDALDVLDVLRWSVVGPVLVIGLGTSMIVSGWRGKQDEHRAVFGPALDETTVLGDRDLVAGPTFSGGSVTAVLADVDLDLRGTELVSSPATLTITTVMAEAKVHVPPSWRVRTSGSALLSDVKVRRPEPPADEGAPELVVQTAGLLGDISIR